MLENKGRYIIGFEDMASERQQMPVLDVDKRTDNFEEVERGFTVEQAQKEAPRCLSCRRCLGCGLCLAVCEPKAIVFEQEDELIDLTVDAIVISNEAARPVPQLKDNFGYGKYENVITSFEFERILNKNGPYGGLILRPFDGEIPRRLCFIIYNMQNHVGQKKNSHALISRTLEEALLVLKDVKDLKVSIFVPEETVANKLILKAENQGVTIKKGKIAEMREADKTKNLIVLSKSEGKQEEEEYDLLVISTIPEVPAELKDLYKKLGLDEQDQTPSSWESTYPLLIETSVPNVFLTALS